MHTFGMRFPILAVLLDRHGAVVGLQRMPPRRVLLPRRRVCYVLECGADATFQLGDVLRWG